MLITISMKGYQVFTAVLTMQTISRISLLLRLRENMIPKENEQLVRPHLCCPDYLGVLTKADTINDQELQNTWVKIINNQHHQLRHGYYVTHLGWPEARGNAYEWATIRQNERMYFDGNQWSNTPRDRLGTEKLEAALSDMLYALTAERYFPNLRNLWYRRPALESSLRATERSIDQQLGRLPEDLSENGQEKLHLLSFRFISDLSKFMNGYEGHRDFLQQLRPQFEALKQKIEQTDPMLEFAVPNESTDVGMNSPLV